MDTSAAKQKGPEFDTAKNSGPVNRQGAQQDKLRKLAGDLLVSKLQNGLINAGEHAWLREVV